jgi:hypothetical protein
MLGSAVQNLANYVSWHVRLVHTSVSQIVPIGCMCQVPRDSVRGSKHSVLWCWSSHVQSVAWTDLLNIRIIRNELFAPAVTDSTVIGHVTLCCTARGRNTWKHCLCIRNQQHVRWCTDYIMNGCKSEVHSVTCLKGTEGEYGSRGIALLFP